jgi:hypothetical protein
VTRVFNQRIGALIDHLEGHDVTTKVVGATANLLTVDGWPRVECFCFADRAAIRPGNLLAHTKPQYFYKKLLYLLFLL